MNKEDTCYIAGKITGLDDFKSYFDSAERNIKKIYGCKVINPVCLPLGLKYSQYMKICFAMVKVSTHVYMLSNWKESLGAKLEHDLAIELGLIIYYEEK